MTFKIKTGYYLELLVPETMKFITSTKNKVTKGKNPQNVPHLDITEVVLVHCNIVNNDYQQYSRVLYTFVASKPFGQFLEILATSFIFLKTFKSKFQEIDICFINRNSKPLETEEIINLTLVIK